MRYIQKWNNTIRVIFRLYWVLIKVSDTENRRECWNLYQSFTGSTVWWNSWDQLYHRLKSIQQKNIVSIRRHKFIVNHLKKGKTIFLMSKCLVETRQFGLVVLMYSDDVKQLACCYQWDTLYCMYHLSWWGGVGYVFYCWFLWFKEGRGFM